MGTVTDETTGAPLPGAHIAVSGEGGPTVNGTSAEDGRYNVAGSVTTTCNIDYFVSVHVDAEGYHSCTDALYTSATYRHLDVALRPWLAGDCDLDQGVDVAELVGSVGWP
jgi:hypothetical protein